MDRFAVNFYLQLTVYVISSLPRLITSSTMGYDGSMMNGLQSLNAWANYFNYPTGGKLGLLNAIQVRSFLFLQFVIFLHHQNIGALAAYPFAPYVSDGIGRRPTVFFGAVIMCIATIIQTASQSVGMFIGARYVCTAQFPFDSYSDSDFQFPDRFWCHVCW